MTVLMGVIAQLSLASTECLSFSSQNNLPAEAARCRGVIPPSPGADGSAPASRRSRSASTEPACDAKCRGQNPCLSFISRVRTVKNNEYVFYLRTIPTTSIYLLSAMHRVEDHFHWKS